MEAAGEASAGVAGGTRVAALTPAQRSQVADVLERHAAAVKLLPQLGAVEQRWALLAAVLAPKDGRLRHMRADGHLPQTTHHEGGQ